jgi:hypothetical protein
VVTGTQVREDGKGAVTVDLWLENDRIGITTPAEATVLLPLRES